MAYDHGLWKHLEMERVTQRIMACMDTVLQGEYTWHACAGVEHLLRACLAQTVPLETPGWLPFQNGALCLATMTLHPHCPERPFTWQLPHDYDPQATCPQTQAWLHEAVGGAHDQVQVLRAYAKAVVTRRVDLHRYLETLGPGGTGKGTYPRLLMALNVGRAHKLDQSNGYEQQDRWLYPHYRAWVDDTGRKPLSSRRFTVLLRDLFENQLRLDGVEHRDDNSGGTARWEDKSV